jgi:hypothetical protein
MTIKELRDLLYKVDETAVVCVNFTTTIKDKPKYLIIPINSVTETKTYFPGDGFTASKTLVSLGTIVQDGDVLKYKSENKSENVKDTSYKVVKR